MISFSDYMQSLYEDFDHSNSQSKKFGEITPSSKKNNDDLGENNNIQESDEFGIDKLDQPDSEGFDAAASAANSFTNASDGEDTDINMIFNKSFADEDFDNLEEDVDMRYFDEAYEPEETDIPDLPADVRNNLREAAEYILNVLNEEEYAPNGEDEDDYIDSDGVDQNTVPSYPEENDQFSNVDGLSDDFVDNDIEESFTNWDDIV